MLDSTIPVDEFSAKRADWVAQGRPSDHPYMVEAREALANPAPSFIEPLVIFTG